MASQRTVEMRRNVLARHDEVAGSLRERFERTGTHVVNMVSSPGTGKTTLLTLVLAAMIERGLSVAALVGDCATDNDAQRLAASGAPVRQIVTEGLCHLEVSMIEEHLEGWDLDGIDFLFVENVGNLVCPASFDLGESTRMVLLSVTEGEDKPLKYPQMFHSSELAVITKMDLAEPCEFDRDAAIANIEAVHPGLAVFETAKRDAASIERLIDHLVAERSQLRTPSTLT